MNQISSSQSFFLPCEFFDYSQPPKTKHNIWFEISLIEMKFDGS